MTTVVPRAEERVGVRPMAGVRREAGAPDLGAAAGAQSAFGRAAASEALSFGESAIRKQERVDGLELAKIKAQRDAQLKAVLTEEERDPDYEGMGGRVSSRMKKYDDDLRKSVDGRLLKYVDPMIEAEGAKLVPVLQEMYLRKQDDRAAASAVEAVNQFMANGDWGSAAATVDGMYWLKEAERARMKAGIEAKRRAYEHEVSLQQDTPALFNEYGFDGLAGARAYIRDNYSGDEEEKRVSAAESYWREMQQDRNAREAKAYDDIIGMMEDGASAHRVKEAIDAFGWSTRLAKRQVKDEYMRHYRIGDYAPSASDTVHTDRNTLLALWELQDGGALLDVAPDFASFKAQFGDRLSTTDLRTYRNYYSDLEKGVAKHNVAIKMNYGSVFRKMMEEEKIKGEQKTAFYLDRFNADYDAMVRDAKGRPVTNEMAVTLMQDILAPEVVGQKKGPLWLKTDITVRRGDIPRGAERGADGRWYIADEYGHYRPIIFPGTEGSAGTAEIDWDLPPLM